MLPLHFGNKIIPLLCAFFDRRHLESRDEPPRFMASMDWDDLECDPIVKVDLRFLFHLQGDGLRQGESKTTRREISGDRQCVNTCPRQATRHHDRCPRERTPGKGSLGKI